MKNLAKTLLLVSAVALPMTGYAGSGHEHKGTEKHQKMEQCIPGKQCPFADKMGKMQSGMGGMMKDMKMMKGDMGDMMGRMGTPEMKEHMQQMHGDMKQMHEHMEKMQKHMGKMQGMMKGKSGSSDKGGDGHNHKH